MTVRGELLAGLADQVDALIGGPDGAGGSGVTRVGVDGVDGAGKTVFADELGAVLRDRGRPVIRSGTDHFHHPRAVRHRRGRDSPDGFFLDSFDLDLMRSVLLDPLGPGGDGRYRAAAFDHVTDRPVDAPWQRARPGSVLVFDGIFTHRPELRDHWDLSIFLLVDTAVSVVRCAARDGTPADPAHPANRRYVEGQRRYLAECDPLRWADVVVNNTDLDAPFRCGARM